MLEFWLTVLPVPLLLALGYTVGTWRERRHLASLDRRERALQEIRYNNLKRITEPQRVRQATLVLGQAVIATDYFKFFAAQLRGIVGGEMRTFNTLLSRARREAIVRMLEEARRIDATEVWNVRLETSNIRSAQRNQPGVSVEIFAFGTAVVRA